MLGMGTGSWGECLFSCGVMEVKREANGMGRDHNSGSLRGWETVEKCGENYGGTMRNDNGGTTGNDNG